MGKAMRDSQPSPVENVVHGSSFANLDDAIMKKVADDRASGLGLLNKDSDSDEGLLNEMKGNDSQTSLRFKGLFDGYQPKDHFKLKKASSLIQVMKFLDLRGSGTNFKQLIKMLTICSGE
jgi:hypothetical protein